MEYKNDTDRDKENDPVDDAEDDNESAVLGLGTVYEDDSVFAAYDYSHLLPSLEDDHPSGSESGATSSPLSVVSGRPETDRVVQRPAVKPIAVTEPRSTSSEGPSAQSGGRIAFVCRLGLTVDEAAVITVKSRLYAASLAGRAYAGVSQFTLSSMAEIAPHELVVVSGQAGAEAKSILDVTEPVFPPGEGQSLWKEVKTSGWGVLNWFGALFERKVLGPYP